MTTYSIKYVTDENNNRVLPITHTDAVRDENGTTVTTLLSKKVSIDLVPVNGTTVTQTLDPNKYYTFGEVTSLNITLNSPLNGVNNEYVFEFDSGTTATALTVTPPSDASAVMWFGGSLSIVASKHYEVSIKYSALTEEYFGIIIKW